MITRYSIVTLVLFILSIFFVIVPVRIPLPFPRSRPAHARWHLPLNLTTAPILAIALLWAAQCLGPATIRAGIVGTDGIEPYNILLLFFSLAYMAITLDATGVLEAAAHAVRNRGGARGRRVFAYFYALLTLVSVVVGNDPVILTGTSFLTYYTKELQLDPVPWLIAEFAAANTASMVLFVGNPTNVVICEGFGVNNVAFSAYTVFPFLACIVASFLVLLLQFRSDAHVPRVLSTADQKDPRKFLLDPVGAAVGTVHLVVCLAVILVVSFFGVDVWKIALPFAVAKFVWDLAWDEWRWRRGMIRQRGDAFVPEAESQAPTVAAGADEAKGGASPRGGSSSSSASPREDITPIRDIRAESQAPTGDEAKGGASPRGGSSSSSASPREDITPIRDIQAESQAPTADEAKGGASPRGGSSSSSASPRGDITPMRATLAARLAQFDARFAARFYTLHTALPRLPFALVPFAFSQFILVEALGHQGWIEVFATWLLRATRREIYPTVWLVGVLGVLLCNVAGTNIGATILLTKVCRAASLPAATLRAAAIALAVASNVGAVSFTFSASLAGLLWRGIIEGRGIRVRQRTFAYWNMGPIVVMTGVGLAVVCAEMAVLY